MSATHTPGPWKAAGYYVRQAGNGGNRMITDIAFTGPHHTPPQGYPKSCRLVDEANARLIAAAPELLEALTRLRGAEKAPTSELLNAFDYADYVIAKATGKKGGEP